MVSCISVHNSSGLNHVTDYLLFAAYKAAMDIDIKTSTKSSVGAGNKKSTEQVTAFIAKLAADVYNDSLLETLTARS